MTTGSFGGNDPFSDHAAFGNEEREFITESTLNVGRNASLTLGTDSLIVLGDGLREVSRFNCCGLLPTKSTSTRSIPYFNILWAEATKVDLTISYAQPVSKISVRAVYINYNLESSSSASETAQKWIARLLDRAYGQAQRKKRIKLVINPYGGAGKAVKLYTNEIEPIFAAAQCEVDVEKTNYSGHAVEIAEKLGIGAFDVIAACSGDGVPHEIFNGLGKKQNATEALRRVAVAQLPCGTGNAMSWNMNGTGDCSTAALCIVKGVRTPLDLASISQGNKRTLSFLSQSLGIVAESDLGTDNIRWMGDARFTFGFLVRLLGKTLYPCDIAVKTEIEEKFEIKKHYAQKIAMQTRGTVLTQADLDGPLNITRGLGLPPLKYGTINDPLPIGDGWTPLIHLPKLGNLYSGNMTIMAKDAPFFPASLPSDGLLDLVTINGDIGRLKSLELLLAVPKNTFLDMDCVTLRKISAMRVIPRFGKWSNPDEQTARQGKLGKVLNAIGITGSGGHAIRDGGYFSVDGEKLPFEPFQIEVHKGLGTVLSRRGGVYQAPGPKGWESINLGLPNEGTESDSA